MQPTNPTDTADPDFDYIPSDIDTTLTIPAGRTTASLTVNIIDDKLVEADGETFQLILVRNPLSLPECVITDSDIDTATVTIVDDDCKYNRESLQQLCVLYNDSPNPFEVEPLPDS